jgi:inosose dehydratase
MTTVPEAHARIAAAPISWGVSEVPGWGVQLDVDRVLTEMASAGLSATEFGPEGFLPDDAGQARDVLAAHGLRALGGFVPVVLHDPAVDAVAAIGPFLERCRITGADRLVLAAATGLDGYDARPELSEDQWAVLLGNLDLLDRAAAEQGVVASVHPHIGTMIETGEHVDRIVAGSSIGICLDTGHLLAAGTDPVAVAERHAARIVHVHLKDVDGALARRVADGALPFSDAITAGLFVPAGDGDVDVDRIVLTLEDAGFRGWYVLEQDIKLASAPGDEVLTAVITSRDAVAAALTARTAH